MKKDDTQTLLDDVDTKALEALEIAQKDLENGADFNEVKRTIIADMRQQQQRLVDEYERVTGKKYVPEDSDEQAE